MRRSVSARGSLSDGAARSCVKADRSTPIDWAKAARVEPERSISIFSRSRNTGPRSRLSIAHPL
jgi:hypothetical protein